MPRQSAPVPVPIASYIGLRITLYAICDGCQNVATLDPAALVEQRGQDFTMADLKARLRCGRCGSWDAAVQVNGSLKGRLVSYPAAASVDPKSDCDPICDPGPFPNRTGTQKMAENC